MTSLFKGSCLCGAVAYELRSTPKAVSHCHCRQCQKSNGAAFASFASVPRADLQITQGTDTLKGYASSPTVLRQFCGQCGASLFWSRTEGDYSDWVSIALSSLDDPFVPAKQKHLHVQSKATWCEMGV
ncbi:GFA family protein [Pseudomonas fontis]|uniref:GFA family protein n=1 Tax=Pseudomonas fontis TaxID=2942633 RepID=A0ABT5NNN4_9PSED|nr:GFA family protein [Pseudomonas fontis]MDD0973003.1 GFA family protein [Pseudomonas fontis]MDD0989772.1 GFA family protein [Pseudomonas fontis]